MLCVHRAQLARSPERSAAWHALQARAEQTLAEESLIASDARLCECFHFLRVRLDGVFAACRVIASELVRDNSLTNTQLAARAAQTLAAQVWASICNCVS